MKKIFIFLFLFPLINISQENRGYIVNIGDKSPEFSLNEKKFLEQNKGKVIMLQFTASWCSVCIREMPYIENEIWLEHKENEDFVLIALAKDTEQYPQGKKEISQMIEKTAITYPLYRDENSKIFNLFAENKAGVTRNVIIDKKGNIAFLTRLFERNEFNEMKNKINKLLNN
tara:strand:+ start:1093 stop:1608 length:516 start_codon:yes stop_codon:yes gene_type:complete